MGRPNLQIELMCIICGTKQMIKRSRKNAKYCSKKCRVLGMLGHKPFHYKGGKYIHKGYILVLSPKHPNATKDGYVYEHRLVMEKHIGRFLDPKEIVHHKNHIRDDNRIENLELLKSQSEHMKEHAPELVILAKTKPHPWLGRKHTTESRQKMSIAKQKDSEIIRRRVRQYWHDKRLLRG